MLSITLLVSLWLSETIFDSFLLLILTAESFIVFIMLPLAMDPPCELLLSLFIALVLPCVSYRATTELARLGLLKPIGNHFLAPIPLLIWLTRLFLVKLLSLLVALSVSSSYRDCRFSILLAWMFLRPSCEMQELIDVSELFFDSTFKTSILESSSSRALLLLTESFTSMPSSIWRALRAAASYFSEMSVSETESRDSSSITLADWGMNADIRLAISS